MGNFKVIILAAGFGERLNQSINKIVNLSDEEKEHFFFSDGTSKPKALLKIGGKEVLLRNITQLQEINEIDLGRDVALVTNHKYGKYFQEWMSQTGLNIRVIDNGVTKVSERKGAVVDLYEAAQEINPGKEPTLVLGSDIVFDQFKLRELIEAFSARNGTASVLPVYMDNSEHANKAGNVEFDPETKIIKNFVEKPNELDASKEFWISPALYLYNREALNALAEYVENYKGRLSFLDSPGQFNEYLVKHGNKEAKVEVLEVSGERFEISDYADWHSASDYFNRNEAREYKRELK